jgi:hypothetical protein
MATLPNGLNLPYPEATDPVNVHGDIYKLVSKLEEVLPPLGVSNFQIPVTNKNGSLINAGTPVYAISAAGNGANTAVAVALPTNKPILGLVKRDIADNADGIVVVAGILDNVNTSGFGNVGDVLYVAETGGLTTTQPTGGAAAVGVVAVKHSTAGVIIVEAKGNGTWGSLKAGLS